MDEKGFLLGVSAKCRVVCRRGRRNLKYTHDGNKELISVLEYISTEGVVLSPLVVTKGINHYIGIHIKGQGGPEWVYRHSPKG
jgi:hypothetical protein